MTRQVDVDADLAARAEEIARMRGDQLEDVVTAALRAYIHQEKVEG